MSPLRSVLLVWLLCASVALASPFPTKPLRLIVPAGPGSAPDIAARELAPALSAALGQPVWVDNRSGARGAIAAREAAVAPPDGHTLFLGSIASQVLNDLLAPDPSFSAAGALAPVILQSSGPLLWVAGPGLPARDVADALAFARHAPGRLSYASTGPGSLPQLLGTLIEQGAGVALHEVPYKTLAQEFPDVVSGEVATTFAFYATVAGHLQSKRLRALAVTSARRLSVLPDVPTFAEAGLPGVEATAWQGWLVPVGTPPDVVRRLHEALSRIQAQPAYRERLLARGADPGGGTPAQFAAFIDAERERWRALLQARGLAPR